MRYTYILSSIYRRIRFPIFYITSTPRPYIIASNPAYRRPFLTITYNIYTTSYYILSRITYYN